MALWRHCTRFLFFIILISIIVSVLVLVYNYNKLSCFLSTFFIVILLVALVYGLYAEGKFFKVKVEQTQPLSNQSLLDRILVKRGFWATLITGLLVCLTFSFLMRKKSP